MVRKKRNIFPNKYKIHYEDFRGRKKTTTINALTSHEAIMRFRSKTSVSNKNVSARLIKR